MSNNKTERQLNLLFLLLNATRPIEREDIRRRIPGYFNKSDEAFERMFERDKEDLRDLEIPIETLSIDSFHDDVSGYLIKKDNWLIPPLTLSATERSLLNLASVAWREAQISSALNQAVDRLSQREAVQSHISLEIARQGIHLDKLLSAMRISKCVKFTYSSAHSKSVETRMVAPWRIYLSQGNSYLVGFDQIKGEQRTFRLSRISGEVLISDEDILEFAPENLSAAKMISDWRNKNHSSVLVRLDVRISSGGLLRLLAENIEPGLDFDRLEINSDNLDDLAREVAKVCADVKVIEPLELKLMVDRLLMQATR